MNCGSLETEHGLPFNFSRAESEFVSLLLFFN